MKKFLTFLVSFFIVVIGFAQAPNMINYQGIARNSVGNVLPNQAIAIKLSIRDLTATGAVVYSEIRNVTTNFYGLFSFGIGSPGATGVTGTIAGVNWAVGAKFLMVEIDPAGGSSFTNVGTTQLLSVPYSLYSNAAAPVGPAGGDLSGTYPNPTVARIRGINVSTTAPTIGQFLRFDGTNWVPATNVAGALTLPYRDSASSATQPVVELIQLNLTTVQPGLSGVTRSTASNAVGVLGTVNSTSPGGFSAAVRGVNNGIGGLGIGVYGQQAGSGWGVYGTTPSGIGVYGNSTNGFGVYGLSTNGIGVYGLSTNAGAGVFEISNNASTANALSAITNGTGFAADIASTNATPKALRTVGGVQLTGIGEALNRVLTSDAAGNATWQAIGGGGLGAITGSGTLNYLPKWTPNGTTLGNSLIFDDGTYVGIGTIAPSYILDVAGVSRITDAVGQDQALIIKSTGANGNRISFTDPSDTRLATVGLNPTNSQLLINNVQDPGASTTLYPVVLQAGSVRVNLQSNNGLLYIGNNVDRLIIKPDGKVGIGTTTPANKLDILETGTTNGGIDVQLTNASNGNIGINVTHSGSGKGIRSSTVSGFAVEGITSSISSGGIIGRNTGGGEAIIGFTTAAGAPAGAVVGRNDGDYAGVHGFSTHANGIGVVARVITAVAGTSTALLANNAQGGALGDIAIFQSSSANVARIDRTGKGFFNNGTQVGGADVAEYFNVEGSRISYEPGDILVISQTSDRQVEKSSTPYSTLVAGVVATKPGVSLTEENAEQNKLDAMVPMGVIGVIPTKVCTEGGAIKRGDMLVTSSIVGVAMKADPEKVKVGQVLGKALQDFDATTVGIIKVLVSVK